MVISLKNTCMLAVLFYGRVKATKQNSSDWQKASLPPDSKPVISSTHTSTLSRSTNWATEKFRFWSIYQIEVVSQNNGSPNPSKHFTRLEYLIPPSPSDCATISRDNPYLRCSAPQIKLSTWRSGLPMIPWLWKALGVKPQLSDTLLAMLSENQKFDHGGMDPYLFQKHCSLRPEPDLS